MILSVSIIIILMLSGVMIVNYTLSKRDTIERLRETTVNNISAISNKISGAGDDNSYIENIINSEFDSGYYNMMEFKSSDGNYTYKQIDYEKAEDVPQWFIDFTSIDIKTITVDVTQGWSILGTLSIDGDANIVYQSIYSLFISLLYLFVLFTIFSISLLSIFLYFILKPLKMVRLQASAILNDEFVIQDKIPYAPEIRDVVSGMNTMVKKVQNNFIKGSNAIKRYREIQYNDPETKLFNRKYLMVRLAEFIKEDNQINGGTLIIVSLENIESINKNLGYNKAKDFICGFADALIYFGNKFESKIIARLNDKEFVMALSNCSSETGISIAKRINMYFDKTVENNKYDKNLYNINIGVCSYNSGADVSSVLTMLDSTLSLAKADEVDNIKIYENKGKVDVLTKEEWREIIQEAVDNNHFISVFWKAVDTQAKKIIHMPMTFHIDNNIDKPLFYGDFGHRAIGIGMIVDISIIAIENLFLKDLEKIRGKKISIRLPSDFLKDSRAFGKLEALFKKYMNKPEFEIVFEMSDSFVMNNLDIAKNFGSLFKKYNMEVGINSFTGEHKDFTYLKELNPSFIKIDTSFLLDLSIEAVNSIEAITSSLGIEIIPTLVNTDEELNKLKNININTVQGLITDLMVVDD